MRWIIFHNQHPDWQFGSPASADGRCHAVSGQIDLAADSLAALLDELDWFYAA